MNKGIYIGKNFNNSKHKILILGESHHDDGEPLGAPVSYTTESVVENYLSAKCGEQEMNRKWYFFTKIAHSFDRSLGKRETVDFWECVCFGNYIDVNCDVKGGFAEKYLIYGGNTVNTENECIQANRIRLNDDLFRFINNNKINTIVCVSKLVNRFLPEQTKSELITEIELNSHNSITKRKYRANEKHLYCSVKLQNDLTVFVTTHPAAYGYKPMLYNENLKRLI